VGKGGLVKDPQVHAAVLGRFINWAIDHEFRLLGLVASPILGAEGNKEFLVLLRSHKLKPGSLERMPQPILLRREL
jgi:23S rRNA (cytidine1920-2'-O)/16S rRNA (cytidine1409-2'-O)-methyltransferase